MAKAKSISVYFDRESNKFVGITEQVMKQLSETYKGIDVTTELNKMCLWLTSAKGRRRQGNIGFIVNWLGNATPSQLTAAESLDLLEPASPLASLLQDYLQGLWKNREHILAFNTIQKPT